MGIPKIHVICFIVLLALLQWSGTEPTLSLRYACIRKSSKRERQKGWNSLRFKEPEEFCDAAWEDQSCKWEDRFLLVTKSQKVGNVGRSWKQKAPKKYWLSECSKEVGEDDDWDEACRLPHVWWTFLHVGIFLEMLFIRLSCLFF